MSPEATLATIARELRDRGIRFALVGGLAVSLRAEVRFTRDVDLAIVVNDDAEVEALVRDLARSGFVPVAVVEQDERHRIAITRLQDASGVVVDLLSASTGIEQEIVDAASVFPEGFAARVPVASSADLLAMKVLSLRPARLQDRIDAQNLLAIGKPDLSLVRQRLALITQRGYARDQDLGAKLDALLAGRE